MEIIGRITADATISETKAGKKVVNFSIAINDTYKTKDSHEVKQITTYVNCAYWKNEAISAYLTKGTLVELQGRVGVNAWSSKEGEAKAVLTLQVNNIKLHGKAAAKTAPVTTTGNPAVVEPADDLPF